MRDFTHRFITPTATKPYSSLLRGGNGGVNPALHPVKILIWNSYAIHMVFILSKPRPFDASCEFEV
ncbi:MAG: hypothetical protein KAT26_04240, partial [Marinosulfonomonas sp.]|nr:hypothetical protein [Marinosulfonomonas sp.]